MIRNLRLEGGKEGKSDVSGQLYFSVCVVFYLVGNYGASCHGLEERQAAAAIPTTNQTWRPSCAHQSNIENQNKQYTNNKQKTKN